VELLALRDTVHGLVRSSPVSDAAPILLTTRSAQHALAAWTRRLRSVGGDVGALTPPSGALEWARTPPTALAQDHGEEALRPQAAQCLRDIVAETACNSALHVLLTGLLAQPGRVLAPEGPAKWLRFVVEPCDALGGDLASTPCAVAAVECVLAATLAQHSC